MENQKSTAAFSSYSVTGLANNSCSYSARFLTKTLRNCENKKTVVDRGIAEIYVKVQGNVVVYSTQDRNQSEN